LLEYLKPTPAPDRGSDAWGAGHFGASRGSRTHAGADFLVPAGRLVLSPVDGILARIGTAYRDAPEFKIAEIQAEDGVLWRLFYVRPFANVGDRVFRGIILGIVQDLEDKFGDHPKRDERGPMPNHVHLETVVAGEKVDPVPILESLEASR